MIDWAQVRTLRGEVGEEAFDEVVELFLEEVEEVVTRLRNSPNTASFEEDLHFLKGSAMNLGFVDFAALCQEGEATAAAGRADELDLAPILDSFDASKAVFTQQLTTSLVA